MIRQNWVSYFEEADNGVSIKEHAREAFRFARFLGRQVKVVKCLLKEVYSDLK